MSHVNPETEHSGIDYATLREAGIRLLEQLTGRPWTDFNAHDPGITLLEQLCYALSDLGYRIAHPIQDLLSGPDADPYRWLPGPDQVLGSGPVGDDDLRRLLLDTPGVRDAWIDAAPARPGILFDPDRSTLYLDVGADSDPDRRPNRRRRPLTLRGLRRVRVAARGGSAAQALAPRLTARLQAQRPLARDFVPVEVLPRRKVRVDTAVELQSAADPDRVLRAVGQALDHCIAPPPRFRTLTDRLETGQSLDAIYDGPLLDHGFLDTAGEPARSAAPGRMAVRKSDLVRAILGVEGVRSIRALHLAVGGGAEVGPEDGWSLEWSALETPVLDPASRIRLLRDGAALVTGAPTADPPAPRRPDAGGGLAPPPGRDRRVARYHSIQHQFPALYGIGEQGLPATADRTRRAEADQLKAYLCLFEQLLANAFGQLGLARELLSPAPDLDRSHASQALGAGVPDADRVIDRPDQPPAVESPRQALARLHRFADHLLARFGESPPELGPLESPATPSIPAALAGKRRLLRSLPAIGYDRARGQRLPPPRDPPDDRHLAGLERRLRCRLGLSDADPRWFASHDDGIGFHLIEHLLLRPGPADLAQWRNGDCRLGVSYGLLADPIADDPYSDRISFVFPGWPARFRSDAARTLVQRLLREDTPAHLHWHLHWLSRDAMRVFETAYRRWIEAYADSGRQAPGLRDARDRMIDLLGIGATWPRRDLDISAPDMVPAGDPAHILILDPQPGVRYQLCDDDGLPVAAGDTPVQGIFDEPDGPRRRLITPPLTENRSYSLLASRPNQARAIRGRQLAGGADPDAHPGRRGVEFAPAPVVLDTYLDRILRIRAGINRRLPVAFVAPAETLPPGADTEQTIDYAGAVTVIVHDSQQGVDYSLHDHNGRRLTDPVPGKGPDTRIHLTGTDLREDARLRVHARRRAVATEPVALATDLTLKVRPDPAVDVRVDVRIPQGGDALVRLDGAQQSCRYQLWVRNVADGEYRLPGAAGPAAHPGQRVLTLEPPGKTPLTLVYTAPDPSPGEASEGLRPAGELGGRKAKRQLDLSAVNQDTLILVRAIKKRNGAALWLDQAGLVLVQPRIDRRVTGDPMEVDRGDQAVIRVHDPQPGVRYQLTATASGRPIGAPGYRREERGVSRARIDLDLRIGDPGPATIDLPTGPLTRTTRFTVQASRIIATDFGAEPPRALMEPVGIAGAPLQRTVTITVARPSRPD